jgi:hypothetical protein
MTSDFWVISSVCEPCSTRQTQEASNDRIPRPGPGPGTAPLKERILENITIITLVVLATSFTYSCVVFYRVYRETGQKWMLFLPQWIDAGSGVSRPLRIHGIVAFSLLFVGMILFYKEFS